MSPGRGRGGGAHGRALAAAVLCCCLVGTGLAGAEVVQKGDLRVSFEGRVLPNALPRRGTAPVAVTVAGEITSTDRRHPPQLRRISLAINRNGRLDYRGLPVCHLAQIRAAPTTTALRLCGGALVGRGRFRSKVVLPEQSPFPSNGRIVAFNGLLHGRHVVFAHIFGSQPLPEASVLTFRLARAAGAYRTALVAELPRAGSDWGFVSGIRLTLHRRFRLRGRSHSYVSASCPAPDGFPGTSFPLARVSFGFVDGRTLTSTLTRSCRVRGG